MTYAVVAGLRRTAGVTLIALTITASTTDGPDPLASGRARVSKALDAGFSEMVGPHVQWWEQFWKSSDITLPDELEQRHYNLVRYMLGAASRLGAPPIPLQGVWTADGGLPSLERRLPSRPEHANDLRLISGLG